mgnify:CR=1 FL=1
MIAERLQERLCAELREITKNIDFEDQDGSNVCHGKKMRMIQTHSHFALLSWAKMM